MSYHTFPSTKQIVKLSKPTFPSCSSLYTICQLWPKLHLHWRIEAPGTLTSKSSATLLYKLFVTGHSLNKWCADSELFLHIIHQFTRQTTAIQKLSFAVMPSVSIFSCYYSSPLDSSSHNMQFWQKKYPLHPISIPLHFGDLAPNALYVAMISLWSDMNSSLALSEKLPWKSNIKASVCITCANVAKSDIYLYLSRPNTLSWITKSNRDTNARLPNNRDIKLAWARRSKMMIFISYNERLMAWKLYQSITKM